MGLRKLAARTADLLLAVACVAALLGQGAGLGAGQGAAREAESAAFQRTERSYSRAGGCTPLHAEAADYLDMPPDRQEAPDDDDDEGEQGDDVDRWLETQHFVAHRGRRQRPHPDDAGADRGLGGEEGAPSVYWRHGPIGLGIREQLEALLDAQEPPGDGATATPPPPAPPAPARHTDTGRPGPAFRLEHIFAPTRGRRSGGTDLTERVAAPPRPQQRPSRGAWHRGQRRACGRQQAMTLASVQERLRACEARLGSGDDGRVDQQPQVAGQSAPPSTSTAAPAEARPTAAGPGTRARRQRAYSILLTLR